MSDNSWFGPNISRILSEIVEYITPAISISVELKENLWKNTCSGALSQ